MWVAGGAAVRRVGRSLTVVVVLAGVLLVPRAAGAHSRLLQTAPAAGTTLTAPVDEVTMTFNKPIHQRVRCGVVSGPGAAPCGRGGPRVVDNVVHVPVAALRSGAYTVKWRVVSADGH